MSEEGGRVDFRACPDGDSHEWVYHMRDPENPDGSYECDRCGLWVSKEHLKEELG